MSSLGPVKVLSVHASDVHALKLAIPKALADAVVTADDLLHVSILPAKIIGLDAVLIVRDHEWSGWAAPDPPLVS
jgi:hypothetical protein